MNTQRVAEPRKFSSGQKVMIVGKDNKPIGYGRIKVIYRKMDDTAILEDVIINARCLFPETGDLEAEMEGEEEENG